MRNLFLALLIISSQLLASEINFKIINYNQVPGMDFQLELISENQDANHRLLLDCQSFINGIHYQKNLKSKWFDEWFLMMSGNDCENGFQFNYDYAGQANAYCLKVNLEIGEIDFNVDSSNCQ